MGCIAACPGLGDEFNNPQRVSELPLFQTAGNGGAVHPRHHGFMNDWPVRVIADHQIEGAHQAGTLLLISSTTSRICTISSLTLMQTPMCSCSVCFAPAAPCKICFSISSKV